MGPGHFGLAAAVKAKTPALPLWSLMLATFLLDVVFAVLFLAGIESLAPVDPANPNVYGGTLIRAYYTHSLVGALLISAAAGLVAWRAWGRTGGIGIASVTFSHWLLDLLVHRPDLPILPGNAGNLPLLGFGLWANPPVSAAIETGLVLAGAYLYYRAAMQLVAARGERERRPALVATGVTALLLAGMLLTTVLGIG